MLKRKSKKNEDFNEMAYAIAQAMAQVDEPTKEPTIKNPAAVALGRLGGLKGGKARAEKLSAKKRKEIAQKAAKTRWAKKS
jgi:hypothetical protein